jgi:hypothetical protein
MEISSRASLRRSRPVAVRARPGPTQSANRRIRTSATDPAANVASVASSGTATTGSGGGRSSLVAVK